MKSLLNLIVLCTSLYLLNGQFSPTYAMQKNFYTGAAQGLIATVPAATIAVTFAPAGFTISTDPTRKPFIGVCSIQKMAIQNMEAFYYWTKLLSFTATSFNIEIRTLTATAGFGTNFIVKFRYIIVSSLFPSFYLSRQIYISGSPTLPKMMAINDVYYENFTMTTLAPSTYTNIPLGEDTEIMYSLYDITLNQTGTKNSLLEIKCNFSVAAVTSTTDFTLRMTTRYGVTITKLGFMIFVFNKGYLQTKMGVRIQLASIAFSNLKSASFLMDYFSSKVWQVFSMFYYGFTGFELANENLIGFELVLANLSPTVPNYSLKLNNLVTGSIIPIVYVSIGLITELECPIQSGWTGYYISDTDGKCYQSCPFTDFNSPVQIGLTGVFTCKGCIPTCQTCSGTASNCTTCYTSQYRSLLTAMSGSCIPITGYYEAGVPVAAPCWPPCVNCFNVSINCTLCAVTSYLAFSGPILTCISCTTFDPMCITCSSLKCMTCSTGYIVDINGGCTMCSEYHPMCSMCNASRCTGCNLGYYLNGVSCSPCTDYHLKCTECLPSACTWCDVGFMVKPTGTCLSCQDYHTQCIGCNPTQCTTCNIGYFPNGYTCTPCTNYGPQCTKCTNIACTECLTPAILTVAGLCVSCTFYHPQCTSCNQASCMNCATDFYLIGGTCMPCTNFDTQCTQCTPSTCTMCNSGFMVSTIGRCITCANYYAQCLTCTSSQCSTCGVGFYANGLTCAPCANYHPQCQDCSNSACTLCGTDFYITPTGSCVTCNDYHPSCLTCTGATCTQCTPDHALKNTGCMACSSINVQCNSCSSTGTCLNCNSGFILSSNACLTCTSLYGSKCNTCDPTQCNSCISGYNLVGTQCIYSAGVCGDGQWNELVEECDDGNFDPNDGCDSNCKAEQDFVCLYADKLLSGASFCKYNNPISLEFSSMSKQPSSNTLHVYFTLKPSNLKDQNQTAIKDLLSPFEIVDNQTSTAQIIPYKTIQFDFYPTKSTQQLEITLTYDQLIEGASIRYNVIPANTGIPYISHLAPKTNLFLKLNSGKTGIGYYNFDDQIYQFQQPVNNLSTIVGLIALALMFIGFCLPAGKLVIVEGLAVLQVSYFSILMFNKIPPSYIGFKNLLFTNGYNDPNLIPSPNPSNQMSTYDLLGLQNMVFSNYNFTFIFFFILPFLIGFIGLFIVKKLKNKLSKQIDNEQKNTFLPKQQKTQTKIQKDIKENGWIIVLNRIMYENSFYGLMSSGYLAWVSVFYGCSQNFNELNALGALLIILSWLGFVALLCVVDSSTVNLSDQKNDGNMILKGFAEFRDVFQQVSKNQTNRQPASQRVYVVMMLERVLVSAIIVLASSMLPMSNLFIIGVQLLMIIGLIIMHRRTQSRLPEDERKGIFSHIYKNYTLRQMINLLMTILIQIILWYSQIKMSGIKTSSDMINVAEFIGITAPTIYSALLIVSLVTTIFFWVWQIKSDNVIKKGNRFFRLLFDIPEPQQIDPLTKSIIQNVRQTSSQQKQTQRKLNKQQKDQFESVVEEYISSSPFYQGRNSPFIGAEEKESRRKMIEVLKLQNDKDGTKLNTTTIAEMINEEVDSKNFGQI